MAYTNTPMQSTEENKTTNLFYGWDIRGDGTTAIDTVFKNALVEGMSGTGQYAGMRTNDYFQIMKRHGCDTVPFTGGSPTGTILGVYAWPGGVKGQLIVVTYNGALGGLAQVNVYQYNSGFLLQQTDSVPVANATNNSRCTFQEFLYQNGNIFLFVMVDDATAATGFYISNTGAVTTMTQGTGVGTHSLVAMDGYLFSGNTTTISNSNLNDPLTFNAANFIFPDSYPDTLSKLARVGPYLVAFGADSIQYYFDAANPTGTPLGANVGATRRIGYVGGFANYGDDVFFVGKAPNSTIQLYRMSGLKVEVVADMPFARVWQTQGLNTGIMPYGSMLMLNGHTCYFVRTASVFGNGTSVGESYIFDVDMQRWTKLGFQAAEHMLINTATSQLDYLTGNKYLTYFGIVGDTNVYRFNPSVYQDNGVNFEVKFRTHPLDFGTSRTKFGTKLQVLGDMTSSSSLMSVTWSDNDYQTYSTPRTIDLSFQYQQLFALGSFRKRAFQFSYSDNFPMRWKSFELDYDQGTS